MKFIHIGDCHLGAWRQPELAELTFQSFRYVIDTAIREKVDFVLIAGDFFDSAYPPIEAISEAFKEFRRLKEANISVFMIAGSHDYSASGKSFLEVVEKAGFAKNVYNAEEKANSIYLYPTIYKNVALYGYPGKRSGLEVDEIARIKLHDSPGLFKILMLHTALRDAVGNLPIPAVDQDKLPRADYTALAHLHIVYNKNNRVYSGPLFPASASELEELQAGSFYVVELNGKIERRQIVLKQVEIIDIEVSNALTATEIILNELKKRMIKDKIAILRIRGFIETGKVADIQFNEIEIQAKKQGAYSFLKNTSKLHMNESVIKSEIGSETIEAELINKFTENNKNSFTSIIHPLLHALELEKKEEERAQLFEDRLFSEIKRIASI